MISQVSKGSSSSSTRTRTGLNQPAPITSLNINLIWFLFFFSASLSSALIVCMDRPLGILANSQNVRYHTIYRSPACPTPVRGLRKVDLSPQIGHGSSAAQSVRIPLMPALIMINLNRRPGCLPQSSKTHDPELLALAVAGFEFLGECPSTALAGLHLFHATVMEELLPPPQPLIPSTLDQPSHCITPCSTSPFKGGEISSPGMRSTLRRSSCLATEPCLLTF